MKRNQRVVMIAKTLSDSPNEILNLNDFSHILSAAKTSISEDLDIVRKVFEEFGVGSIKGISGASGGIVYEPSISAKESRRILTDLCNKLTESDRMMAGDLIYTSDLLLDPKINTKMGLIFADYFIKKQVPIDYVLTIETKGIPVAITTSRYLNVPLVISRHANIPTEGSKFSINYVSGSHKTLKTMYISKKAIQQGSNVLIIDDFMRGGGTAKGMMQLVAELGCHTVGTGVVFDSLTENKTKLVSDYISLIQLGHDNGFKAKINETLYS